MLFALFCVSKCLILIIIGEIELLRDFSPVFFLSFSKIKFINYDATSDKIADYSALHLLQESFVLFRFNILNMQLSGVDPGMN